MSKQLVIDNFSLNADTYDDYAFIHRKCARHLISMIGGMSFPRILEIGCGTGIFTRMLRDNYMDAEITAIDISAPMVNNASIKLRNGNIRFLVADGEKIDTAKKFDLITSNASIQWFDSPGAAIELYREALTRNGSLCFSMYGPDTFTELKQVLRTCLKKDLQLSSGNFFGMEDIRNSLKDNFSTYELNEKRYTVQFNSLRSLLLSIKLGGTRGEGLGKDIFFGKYKFEETERTYLKMFGNISATHHVFFCRARP